MFSEIIILNFKLLESWFQFLKKTKIPYYSNFQFQKCLINQIFEFFYFYYGVNFSLVWIIIKIWNLECTLAWLKLFILISLLQYFGFSFLCYFKLTLQGSCNLFCRRCIFSSDYLFYFLDFLLLNFYHCWYPWKLWTHFHFWKSINHYSTF